jgi:D-3-phosphoglycerate dehydrogenase / 2-oxoglutarate reductase
MPKVLIVQPFHEEGMKLFEARPDVACEVVDGALEELAAKIADADGVTIRTSPLPSHVIERAERLKVVSRHGVGYDNIDVEALSRRRIPLAIAADANATAVAEHTLYFMLALAKQGLRYDRATREGQWAVRNSLDAVDLLGRRVLVMGFGRIGREVAKRCAAFGMAVTVHDPYVQANVIEAAGDYRSVPDFEAALPETDVLTVHMPLGADSRGLIGTAELQALPAHAFVINAARGGIVDEAALHDALTSGRIAGAALDVFDQEPPPENHPLFALPNVVLTPHSAGLSKEAAVRMGDLDRAQRAGRHRRQARPLDGREPRGAVKRRASRSA